MNYSMTLMILNGYLSVLSICALGIFVYYLIRNRHAGYFEMRPAIALSTLWLGEIIFRLPIFLTRAQIESGNIIPIPQLPLLIGGIITAIALLCIIRVFSPSHWGNKSWISACILSTAVVLATVSTVLSS